MNLALHIDVQAHPDLPLPTLRVNQWGNVVVTLGDPDSAVKLYFSNRDACRDWLQAALGRLDTIGSQA